MSNLPLDVGPECLGRVAGAWNFSGVGPSDEYSSRPEAECLKHLGTGCKRRVEGTYIHV